MKLEIKFFKFFMKIYEWNLHKVCHHLGKSCEHRYYGDIVLLICNVTSRERKFKWLCECLGGIASRRVTTFPCLVTIGLVQAEINMEIVYLTNHVNSQAIEGLCNVFKRITFWMLFMNCHHLAKFGGHRYCGSRDIMFLVPHVI